MLNLPATHTLPATGVARVPASSRLVQSGRHTAMPALAARAVTVRALQQSDAPTLFAMLTTEEVARFISPPPTSVEGFEKFIAWTERQQAEGRYLCFGIVPAGQTHAVGLIQIRAL